MWGKLESHEFLQIEGSLLRSENLGFQVRKGFHRFKQACVYASPTKEAEAYAQQKRSDLSAPGMPMATSPFSQVMSSEGIRELRNSANALHHRLEESASLLTTVWRAALPSSHGPARDSKAVRSQRPRLILPPNILLPPWSADPEDQEPNGQLGQRGPEGGVPGGRPLLHGGCFQCSSDSIPSPPWP